MKDSKPCSKCRTVKPLSEYFVHSCTKKDGRASECKVCHSIRKRKYYLANYDIIRERQNAYNKRRYRPLRKKTISNLVRMDGETRAQWDHRRQAGIRIDTIKHYGGHCACCGESQTEFLAIDHINNNGARERKEVGSGTRFYYWLKRNGYPQRGYQVLCHNCNLAKQFYRGCPHRRIVLRLVSAA